MTANAGDLLADLTRDTLPVSSISVFITGFVAGETGTIQSDNMFKYVNIATTEFTGKGNAADKFNIKCRYLKTDERIDKKVIKTRKNSNVMVTGELILVSSEFQVDIQDLNFLPMSIANIETSATSGGSASSLYSWSSTISSGRLSAQTMANTSTRISENPIPMDIQTNDEANDENDDELTNILTNDDNTSSNSQVKKSGRKRKKGR
jgi:hypothetical protein